MAEADTQVHKRADDDALAVVDRIVSAMGLGELKSDVKHQGQLLQEVRDFQRNAPRFNPQTCLDQQEDIDNVKTTLFGPYDEPGGVVAD